MSETGTPLAVVAALRPPEEDEEEDEEDEAEEATCSTNLFNRSTVLHGISCKFNETATAHVPSSPTPPAPAP